MNWIGKYCAIIAVCGATVSAEDIAVFPVVGINADKSYMDAFGMLLAKKYESISGQTVVDPIRAGRALEADSNYTTAAGKLGVNEYVELTAIGLYVSRKEYYNPDQRDSGSGKIIVVVRNRDEDDDEDDDDQALLDNGKTVVTALRKDRSGNLIYKAELTLVTYGDIEEASDRFARALFHRISVEDARTQANITRREGMGNNKLFADKISGIKIGGYYPVVMDGNIVGFTSIGYNMRMESRKFFVEFGVNGRFPSAMFDDTKRQYGGIALEAGGSYLFTDGLVGVYAGGGVIPHLNFLRDLEMGFAPYLQFGVTFPRNSRTRFFADVRVAPNVLPITTGNDYEDSYYIGPTAPARQVNYPCEIGLNIGIGW
jgi:hypothetical protein